MVSRRLTSAWMLVCSLMMASILGVAAPVGARAANEPCDHAATDNYFAGMSETHWYALGVWAKIEYVNPQLCSGPNSLDGETFSSSWVALVNPCTNCLGYNIFQVGLDRCQNRAGCPTNTYKFWAYGREQSSDCGQAVAPYPNNVGSIGASLYWYQIVKLSGTYRARIAGSEVATRSASSLETCWEGVRGWQIMDEIGDPGDQSGGVLGNEQTFDDIEWRDNAGVDHAMNRAFTSACDLKTSEQWTASNLHDRFYSLTYD